MTTPDSALADLHTLASPKIAANMLKKHKIARTYLGVNNPQVDQAYKAWRMDTTTDERVAIASHLWKSNIHEARIAAAKLLTQARINPDGAVWETLIQFIPATDTLAISDQVCAALARRLEATPERLDTIEQWIINEDKWVRRAVLTATLPWAKYSNPKSNELANRERILSWIEAYATEHEPIIQKAVAMWLRTLSKHDKPRVEAFLEEHGGSLKAFALKEATALF